MHKGLPKPWSMEPLVRKDLIMVYPIHDLVKTTGPSKCAPKFTLELLTVTAHLAKRPQKKVTIPKLVKASTTRAKGTTIAHLENQPKEKSWGLLRTWRIVHSDWLMKDEQSNRVRTLSSNPSLALLRT